MKRLLLVCTSLLLAVSCGKSDVVGAGDSAGLGRTISSVVVAADPVLMGQMSNICQALRDKDSVFRATYVGSNSKFNFTTAQVNCESKLVSSTVLARIALNGGALSYERLSGDYFVTQVETGSSGVISPLCTNTTTLTQPQLVGTSMALEYSVTSGAGCSDISTHRCLSISTGTKQTDGNFKVTKVDLYKIDLAAGPLSGMVMAHETQSSDVCGNNKNLKNTSTFNGITL